MDRPSALASDSIPFVFDAFDLTGSVDPNLWYGRNGREELPLTDPFDIVDSPKAGELTKVLPLDLAVLTFRKAT